MWLRTCLLTSLALVACAPDFDSTRVPDSDGSFGARVVTLMCKRLAFQADPTDVRGDTYRDGCHGGAMPADAPGTLVALAADRQGLIEAIDTGVPDAFTTDLQAYLASNDVLALYDDGTMTNSIASVADLLDDIANDDAAIGALAREGARDGYRPAAQAFGVPAALVTAHTVADASVPSLNDVLAKTVPALTPGGIAHGEWDSLVAALSDTLADAAPPSDAASPDRTAALAANLLLTERADLVEPAALPLVRRDARGVAVVALVGGAVPAPFVDQDHDQLADIDANGRFVDANGAAIAAPTPFPAAHDSATRDAQGRALANGLPVYGYVDVAKTVVGALGHDASALFDPATGTALDLARGASALLGARTMATHTFDNGTTLDYRGYDTTQSPLLDMTYGWAQLLRDPNVRDLLALADTLLANHEPAVARLVEAAVTAARAGDAHPEAVILTNAPLWDDLIPVLRQIVANPALVRDLLAALQRPEVKALGQRFGEFMTYDDRFDIDPATQAVTGSFTSMPDRTHPDNAYNRSLWQRLLHLISESNHAQLCNKDGATVSVGGIQYPLFGGFSPCDLIEIDNLATFYVESITYAKDASGSVVCEDAGGNVVACNATGARPRPGATMVFKDSVVAGAIDFFGDNFLETQSTITGFRRHPTPAALNRVLFLSPVPSFLSSALAPIKDRDGDLYMSQHAGTLPVWEKNNFYDSIRPIAQAFVDNGSEQLFVDLLAVMDKHWPTKSSISTQTVDPNGPNYVFGSAGNSYEPLLTQIFAGDLLPALVDTAAELDAITANGKSFATLVTNSASFVISPLPGLADRRGNTTTTTADGRPVTTLSPWDVIADAYRGKQVRLAEVAGEGAAWTSAISGVVDLLFRGADGSSGWKFRNAHVVPVTRAVLDFVHARIDAHDQAGDRTTWLAQTLPTNAHDLLVHPVFAGIADVATTLSADPAPRAALDGLLHDAFSETGSPADFAMLRTATADLVQLAADDADLVPIAHLAGALLAPAKSYLPTQLDLIQKLRAADQGTTLVSLAGQLFSGYDTADPGVTALAELANGIGEVDRVHPGVDHAQTWVPDDYKSVLHGIAAFLREQQRGFPRFIAIVQGRNP